ncbi:methyltransferase domain-containing protein [Variovorax sp. RKNM96]|uniref:class I SAM-dependent methyltransferase n=1 Tax=Variovorax sp. RKNM96 TaxID=2681552 RepID=UPI0019802D11|nr:class I SAM-dependent methyltransferase [Variovorax sp. RKNM96]QSI28762.1 methyltransferase domain-containing protein [Variovorax sp. RKNM96]
MKLPFYRAFEERYYAPREYIGNLRRQYLPYASAVLSQSGVIQAIDIGCGRGEWLELMREIGISATGVDLDAGMLKDCLDRGLDVKLEDGLTALRNLPDQSQSIVSAFHVVEHISFDDLRELIAQAYRVLIPGGVIILETPNPENLLVGTKNFYLDPTHQRPLPSELLSFVVDYCEFINVAVLRLQESRDILSKENVRLYDVISGASPDYAVLGQKGEIPKTIKSIAQIVPPTRGADLISVSDFYDEKLEGKFKTLMDVEKRLATQDRQAAATMDFLSRRLEVVSMELSSMRAELAASEARAQQHADQLLAIYRSNSWKVTAPLRMMTNGPRRLVSAAQEGRMKSGVTRRVKAALIRTATFVNRSPKIAIPISKALNRFPSIKERMGKILNASGGGAAYTIDPKSLSPQVREIYLDLKKSHKRQ